MFGIGMPELLVILAVALIVIGPKKLPELAKTLGKAMGEFKRATNDLKQNIEKETGLDEVGKDLRNINRDLNNSLKGAGKFSSLIPPAEKIDEEEEKEKKTPPLVDQAPTSSNETPATQKDTPGPKDQRDSSEPQPSDKTDLS